MLHSFLVSDQWIDFDLRRAASIVELRFCVSLGLLQSALPPQSSDETVAPADAPSRLDFDFQKKWQMPLCSSSMFGSEPMFLGFDGRVSLTRPMSESRKLHQRILVAVLCNVTPNHISLHCISTSPVAASNPSVTPVNDSTKRRNK